MGRNDDKSGKYLPLMGIDGQINENKVLLVGE